MFAGEAAALLVLVMALITGHMAIGLVTRSGVAIARNNYKIMRYMTDSATGDDIIIKSETNTKVKLLKSLNTKKKREENNMVLLEGHRQIIDAINLGIKPQLILLSEKAAQAPLGEKLLNTLQLHKLKYDYCSDSIINSVSDTITSQGIVAAFDKPKQFQLTELNGNISPLLLVLDRVADPGNIGTIIRTAYGMGVDGIIAIEGCDPFAPKVLRSAMGLSLKVPIAEVSNWNDVSSMLDSSKINNFHVYFAEIPTEDNSCLSLYNSKLNFQSPTIVAIGSEAIGIHSDVAIVKSNTKLKCQNIFIPMKRNLESFNAAIAGSIILGEINRKRNES